VKKLLEGFALSWNMLTIIPFFQIHQFYKGINGVSAMFYPLVGLIVGGILYGVSLALATIYPHNIVAIIIFVLSIVITGALHLDGFSDTIDGLFVTKEKALEVMKDSHVGGMGMIFSMAFLLLKAQLFLALENYSVLMVVMMLSRGAVVFAIERYQYISSGVGSLIKEELTKKHLMVVLMFCLVGCFFFEMVWSMVVAFLYVMIASLFFVKRYKGLNGDMYGFLIETTEVFLLLCIVAGDK